MLVLAALSPRGLALSPGSSRSLTSGCRLPFVALCSALSPAGRAVLGVWKAGQLPWPERPEEDEWRLNGVMLMSGSEGVSVLEVSYSLFSLL